jgi:hypothetical protein
MTESGLIKEQPCQHCDCWRRLDLETGFYGCKLHYAGDTDWCEKVLKAEKVGAHAVQVAAIIAACPCELTRREVAEAAAGGFTNAFYELSSMAVFDEAAFLVACGVQVEKAVCHGS